MNTLTDEQKQAQLEVADIIAKLLRSREHWRKLALLCFAILSAFAVMFAIQCARLP
jgi:hypothetical protein